MSAFLNLFDYTIEMAEPEKHTNRIQMHKLSMWQNNSGKKSVIFMEVQLDILCVIMYHY